MRIYHMGFASFQRRIQSNMQQNTLLWTLDNYSFRVYLVFPSPFFLNWRLIALQYCSGFCHTLTRINHGCTCVPHPEHPLPPCSPSHSSGLSQCTSPECLVPCTEPELAICFTYGNIHVSILSFKSSHPLPLPQSPKVCSLHLCLFCCLASCKMQKCCSIPYTEV